jgi:hypothetical protein
VRANPAQNSNTFAAGVCHASYVDAATRSTYLRVGLTLTTCPAEALLYRPLMAAASSCVLLGCNSTVVWQVTYSYTLWYDLAGPCMADPSGLGSSCSCRERQPGQRKSAAAMIATLGYNHTQVLSGAQTLHVRLQLVNQWHHLACC